MVSFQGCGAGINGLRLASQVCKYVQRCLVVTNILVLVIHEWIYFALPLPRRYCILEGRIPPYSLMSVRSDYLVGVGCGMSDTLGEEGQIIDLLGKAEVCFGSFSDQHW